VKTSIRMSIGESFIQVEHDHDQRLVTLTIGNNRHGEGWATYEMNPEQAVIIATALSEQPPKGM